MSRFKIGDYIKIKDNIKKGDEFQERKVENSMLEYRGKIAKVLKVNPYKHDRDDYFLDIDNKNHYWTVGMLEDNKIELSDSELIDVIVKAYNHCTNDIYNNCKTCKIQEKCDAYKTISDGNTICGMLSLISNLVIGG